VIGLSTQMHLTLKICRLVLEVCSAKASSYPDGQTARLCLANCDRASHSDAPDTSSQQKSNSNDHEQHKNLSITGHFSCCFSTIWNASDTLARAKLQNCELRSNFHLPLNILYWGLLALGKNTFSSLLPPNFTTPCKTAA